MRAQRHSAFLQAGALVLAAACGALLGGCASSQMKGTPFYSGEYGKREGPPEDRVNLWPVLYYRNPALSVLWPFAELTDDHVALRPLFSVYGLGEEKEVTNVLWPVARFGQSTGRNRIFPVSWSENSASIFPLYWHRSAADKSSMFDMFFPLWSYRRGPDGKSTHVLPPVFHLRDTDRKRGGHLWPLVGSYTGDDGKYAFAAWPLAHAWSDKSGDGGHMVLPLYVALSDGSRKRFFSLPFSYGSDGTVGDWQCVPPLFHRKSAANRSHFITPLMGWGTNAVQHKSWSYVMPLCLRKSRPEGKSTITPLYGIWNAGDKKSWAAWPLLSGGSRDSDSGQSWWLGPLGHSKWDKDGKLHYVLPFFYRAERGDASTFVSVPWLHGESASSQWSCVPLVYYRGTNETSRTLLTPLYASGAAGDRSWQAVLPLYYKRKSAEGNLFTTVLGGWRSDESGRRWFVPPLLSWVDSREDGGEVWALAPLVHAEWDGDSRKSHVLPLYYYNGQDGTLVSPLISRWRTGRENDVTLIPPLLSWKTAGDKRSDLWMGGALAHLSWGEEAGGQHVFPFYYRNSETDSFMSPVYAKWKKGSTRYKAIPPLLSWHEDSPRERQLNVALGLFQLAKDKRTGNVSSFMLPLYSYDEDRHFYTPLFGWKKDKQNGYMYPLTPLVGVRQGRDKGWWAFPFYSHRRNEAEDRRKDTVLWGGYSRDRDARRSSLFPFFGYTNRAVPEGDAAPSVKMGTYGPSFWSLPACWYRNQVSIFPLPLDDGGGGQVVTNRAHHTTSHGVFPLWSHRSQSTDDLPARSADTSVLLALYDRKSEVRQASPDSNELESYTRCRVLWRLWHYEKLNGDVSVDAFPGITYDTKEDGALSISFMWRLFRYEKNEKGKKLDLLFVPIVRRGAELSETAEAE
ncbi:MAG: hypothetical protein K9N51_12000 [Candidatus Pacebacteria bacterium]|nr:hypothetical protein [Candidatus Paceibacterota bacterium]